MTAVDVLGGKKALGSLPESDLDLIELVRTGFPVKVIESLSRSLGWSLDQLSRALRLPKRTLQRRTDRLDEVQSERLLRLARVISRSNEVLGPKQASTWLNRPRMSLGGQLPVELLDTDLGCQAVLDELGRIEHGVFG